MSSFIKYLQGTYSVPCFVLGSDKVVKKTTLMETMETIILNNINTTKFEYQNLFVHLFMCYEQY